MQENQYLNIAYFSTNIPWAYRIRTIMNEEQKKRFFKSELPDIEKTISRKLSTINILVDNTNMEMRVINRILREKQEEVNDCLENCKAFCFNDIHHIYRVIAYFEATLVQMVAVIDLFIKYISNYYSQILKIKKNNRAILEMLKKDGINTEWKKELYFIRRIVTHYHSGWPSFKKQGKYFQLIINFPKSIRKMKEYKDYPYEKLGINQINNIFRNFENFYKNVVEWFEMQCES